MYLESSPGLQRHTSFKHFVPPIGLKREREWGILCEPSEMPLPQPQGIGSKS